MHHQRSPARIVAVLRARCVATPLRSAAFLALLVVGFGPPLSGQTGASIGVPAVFAKLEGSWTGSGVLLGRPATFSMRWEIAEGGFVRLSFSNVWVGDDGTRTPVLSSEATYLAVGDSALGVWLDGRPQRLTLHAALTDSTVITTWTAATERGRTEYRVRSADEVVVRDVVFVDGAERRFAEATYRRAAETSASPRSGWTRSVPPKAAGYRRVERR